MNRFLLAGMALFAFSAKAQNINFSDVQHIHTSLNHLTVIDLGEPIQFIAAADPDSFQIERVGDKVLLQPLKEGASTNLILWTASRQVSYELDAPGDTARMNVLVRSLPTSVHAGTETSSAKERQEIAATATTQAMLGAQDIVADQPSKSPSNTVAVSLVRILHTSEGTYLQYQVVNHSTTPFRVTTPAVTQLTPTQTSVSLVALRNHQLSSQTLGSFKAKSNGASVVLAGQMQQSDVQPGTSTSGFVLIRAVNGSTPEIFHLDFGSTTSGPIVLAVVI
ncbi:MAG: TrbG/VirB9 family P-type conjugative transfer protein [Acidobacteriota bacterium]|nr:TrbG/VirB9 family P-type conjugative transfer protein [Acidobacteriota bacterium]